MRPKPATMQEYEDQVAAYDAYQSARLAEVKRRFDEVDALRPMALNTLRDALFGTHTDPGKIAAAVLVVEYTAEEPWDGPEWPEKPTKAEGATA